MGSRRRRRVGAARWRRLCRGAAAYRRVGASRGPGRAPVGSGRRGGVLPRRTGQVPPPRVVLRYLSRRNGGILDSPKVLLPSVWMLRALVYTSEGVDLPLHLSLEGSNYITLSP